MTHSVVSSNAYDDDSSARLAGVTMKLGFYDSSFVSVSIALVLIKFNLQK